MDFRHLGGLGRSILNGVLGDTLVRRKNPLALPMGLVVQEPSSNGSHTLSNKVVVLLHGLTNRETIWNFQASGKPSVLDNYGFRLQTEFGYTPLFLRYNTGLPLRENGRRFCELMDQLVAAYPIPIEEVVLLGFSMGGLLMRLAQKEAVARKSAWLPVLTQCYYLGTPHEGSPVEKFGHLASQLVRSIPVDHVRQWADWIDVRSEGIQDLRTGLKDLGGTEMGFSPAARHHFVSGALAGKRDGLVSAFLGDSLVRRSSAVPAAAPEGSCSAHFEGLSHFPLAYSEAVYAQLREWVGRQDSGIPLVLAPEAVFHASFPGTQDVASSQDLAAGVLDLTAVGVEKTAEAVEKVHRAVSRVPHAILQQIPLTRPVSELVENVQEGVSQVVFGSLRLGSRLLQEVSSLVKE
jgi:pimeloyl-ACP methyl ester carboxylesterase